MHYKAVHELHQLFAPLTGVNAYEYNGHEDIQLPSGTAVSVPKAAHCLLEQTRTAAFLKGIAAAIMQLKEDFPGQQLHILYAGCGPYATLVTPLTTLFPPELIKFHLLDINTDSLFAVKKLYEALSIEQYVAEYIHADATAYNVGEQTIHMVISETMLHALVKEPQVEIMRHLIPQMHPRGIFIPEEINVSARMLNSVYEYEYMVQLTDPRRIDLGQVFSISKKQLDTQEAVTIKMPSEAEEYVLHLATDIKVFGSEWLHQNDCSLNLPVKIIPFTKDLAGKGVRFEYKTGTFPRFEYTVV